MLLFSKGLRQSHLHFERSTPASFGQCLLFLSSSGLLAFGGSIGSPLQALGGAMGFPDQVEQVWRSGIRSETAFTPA